MAEAPDFAALFVEPIVQRAAACNARELAMVAWATAKAAGGEAGAAAVAPAVDAIGSAALGLLGDGVARPLAPGQLCTFVWMAARLRLPAPALLKAVGTAVRPQLAQLGWHDLSLLLWGYARLGCKLPKLLAKATRSVRKRLKQHAADGSSSHAATAADDEDPQLDWEGGGSDGSGPSPSSALRPRHLATLAWSFGTLEVEDAKLATALAEACEPRLQDFSPRDLANAAWGFATGIGSPVPQLLRRLAQVGGARIGDFTA